MAVIKTSITDMYTASMVKQSTRANLDNLFTRGCYDVMCVSNGNAPDILVCIQVLVNKHQECLTRLEWEQKTGEEIYAETFSIASKLRDILSLAMLSKQLKEEQHEALAICHGNSSKVATYLETMKATYLETMKHG